MTLYSTILILQSHPAPIAAKIPSPFHVSVSAFHPPVTFFFLWDPFGVIQLSLLCEVALCSSSSSTKKQPNNAMSMRRHLSHSRQPRIRHIRPHAHALAFSFFFFTWQHNPAMLLTVIYETQLKGCEASRCPHLTLYISEAQVCLCVRGGQREGIHTRLRANRVAWVLLWFLSTALAPKHCSAHHSPAHCVYTL